MTPRIRPRATRAPKSTAPGYPVVIRLGPVLPEELAMCEEGSYEDQQALHPSERDRPLETHTYTIAQRYRSQLRIDNVLEAEDVYYAVCSGTFQIRSKRYFRAACKIADALRELVRRNNPDLVDQWPAPYDKPEDYATGTMGRVLQS